VEDIDLSVVFPPLTLISFYKALLYFGVRDAAVFMITCAEVVIFLDNHCTEEVQVLCPSDSERTVWIVWAFIT